MSHRRKEIREAIKNSLIGNTDAGENVFIDRVKPIYGMPFPAIVVTTGDEENRADDVIDHYLARALEVSIDIYVEATEETGIDDVFDEMANQVEGCLKDREAFGAGVMDAVLQRTSPEMDNQGETIIGRLRLTYRVSYMPSE